MTLKIPRLTGSARLNLVHRYISEYMDFFAGSGTTAHAVITLNRQDGGNRKYALVEMADYFDTVLKPRIQKVAYAADWRDGKPVAGSAGQSHMFQYIRLESYEDSLNNVRFREMAGPLSRRCITCLITPSLHAGLRDAAAPACWIRRSSCGRLTTRSTSPATA